MKRVYFLSNEMETRNEKTQDLETDASLSQVALGPSFSKGFPPGNVSTRASRCMGGRVTYFW